MPFAQTLRAQSRALLRSIGLEISRTANPFMSLLTNAGVDLVLDVGANRGQFAGWIRRRGYSGRIVSFEPLTQTYAELVCAARGDRKWDTYNCALGDFDGDASINRSAMSQFSSLVEQTELTRRTFGAAAVQARETVAVHRLDSIIDALRGRSKAVFLKIDTQGFEKRVLDGAINSLGSIVGVRLELSYEPLYEGELTIEAMIAHLESIGYRLVLLEPLGFVAGPRVLQADGSFLRFGGGAAADTAAVRAAQAV